MPPVCFLLRTTIIMCVMLIAFLKTKVLDMGVWVLQ